MTTTDDLETWQCGSAEDGHGERAYCQRCGGSFPSGYRACPYDATALVVGQDPLIGAVLGDRYRIERFAGAGGIGRVYVAQHMKISRKYAIKVPSGITTGDARGRARFMREAEAASRLDHPNVVSVIDVGETAAGLLYIVMDLAEGPTLREWLAERGRLPAIEALALVRQLALGLEHAHERGLVHRDLKPDNIIVQHADERPRILDFGLALLVELGDAGRLTSYHMVVGTPHYMAPEHACGRDVDHRADLFSLGIILYKALAGCMPFDASPIEIAQKYLHDSIPRFADRVPGLAIDPELERLCLHMTAANREYRPATAQDLVRAIDRIHDRFAAARAVHQADTVVARARRARDE